MLTSEIFKLVFDHFELHPIAVRMFNATIANAGVTNIGEDMMLSLTTCSQRDESNVSVSQFHLYLSKRVVISFERQVAVTSKTPSCKGAMNVMSVMQKNERKPQPRAASKRKLMHTLSNMVPLPEEKSEDNVANPTDGTSTRMYFINNRSL